MCVRLCVGVGVGVGVGVFKYVFSYNCQRRLCKAQNRRVVGMLKGSVLCPYLALFKSAAHLTRDYTAVEFQLQIRATLNQS